MRTQQDSGGAVELFRAPPQKALLSWTQPAIGNSQPQQPCRLQEVKVFCSQERTANTGPLTKCSHHWNHFYFKTWFSKTIRKGFFLQCISYECPNCCLLPCKKLQPPICLLHFQCRALNTRVSSWRAAPNGLLPFSQGCALTGSTRTTENAFLWRKSAASSGWLQDSTDYRKTSFANTLN